MYCFIFTRLIYSVNKTKSNTVPLFPVICSREHSLTTSHDRRRSKACHGFHATSLKTVCVGGYPDTRTPDNSNLFQFHLKVQVIGSRLYLCSLTAKRKKNLSFEGCFEIITCMTSFSAYYIPGGGTLWIYGSGSAAGTMEPLAYTRVIWAEFCYPILE